MSPHRSTDYYVDKIYNLACTKKLIQKYSKLQLAKRPAAEPKRRELLGNIVGALEPFAMASKKVVA